MEGNLFYFILFFLINITSPTTLLLQNLRLQNYNNYNTKIEITTLDNNILTRLAWTRKDAEGNAGEYITKYLHLKRFPSLACLASYCSSSPILRIRIWSIGQNPR